MCHRAWLLPSFTESANAGQVFILALRLLESGGGAAWLLPNLSSASPALYYLQILMPELASLRIAVMEEGNRFLGQRIIPVNALSSGKEWAS